MRNAKQDPNAPVVATRTRPGLRRKLTPAEQRLADELLRGDLVIEFETEDSDATRH